MPEHAKGTLIWIRDEANVRALLVRGLKGFHSRIFTRLFSENSITLAIRGFSKRAPSVGAAGREGPLRAQVWKAAEIVSSTSQEFLVKTADGHEDVPAQKLGRSVCFPFRFSSVTPALADDNGSCAQSTAQACRSRGRHGARLSL